MPVQDTVNKVITRKTARGTMAYTIQCANEGFIGAGFNPPQCDSGDVISFEWQPNQRGYKQLVEGTLQVVGKAQQPAQQPQTADKPAPDAGGQSKQGYWDAKEERDKHTQRAIQYQASRNAAIEVAKIALENDCLSLGAKKADKLDILMGFIDETTDRYNQDVSDVMENGKRTGEYDKEAQEVPEEDPFE